MSKCSEWKSIDWEIYFSTVPEGGFISSMCNEAGNLICTMSYCSVGPSFCWVLNRETGESSLLEKIPEWLVRELKNPDRIDLLSHLPDIPAFCSVGMVPISCADSILGRVQLFKASVLFDPLLSPHLN